MHSSVRPRFGHVQDFANPDATKRGPSGRRLCRVCGVEVTGRRRTFCGDECVIAWSVRNSPGFARKHVRKRDKGVCAICGLNCVALVHQLLRLRKKDRARCHAVVRVLGLRRLPSTLWHADHILPVAEGGGSCGLENMRTLCIWCHRGVTRQLRKRLREADRAPTSIDRPSRRPDNRARA